jgi:PAS domain S-box-containing protein
VSPARAKMPESAMPIPNSSDILQAVIEATPDAIFVKDLEGRYVLVNGAAARFLGRPPAEIVGKKDFELYPEETARRFVADDQTVLASGRAESFEGVATSALGTQAYLVTKGVYRDREGRILGIYGISHDITELRKANESLEQTRAALFRSQKMEAVGQLTGGIAHDFNNLLMIVQGNMELLRMRLPDDPYVHELFDEVVRATRHGQDLTSDLLAFSRRRQLNPQPVDVNQLVEGVARLLGRTLGATIRMSTTTGRDAGVALVDPAALEAAILNIALNARDAMPEGGALRIRTSSAVISQSPRTDDDLGRGSYAMIAVQDTGVGMLPEVVGRVFEPFFTTKTAGGGSGLGLSMVYGFVKQSGGNVTIASEPGHGTTVIMFLPHTKNQPAHVDTGTSHLDTQGAARSILVVEDEASVRNTIRRQLESLGHRVRVAETADEALRIIEGPEAPDLVVSDVVLGTGMNGVDFGESARRIRPGLRLVFISGYTAVPEALRRIAAMKSPLLQKPSTLSQLERAVTDAFARRPS